MAYNMNKVVGVLQAGGKSMRFGSPKALAIYKGKPLYLHGLSALQSCSSHNVIVSHPSLSKNFVEADQHHILVIEDSPRYQGHGPMSGLYSAMCAMNGEWYIQLACDMPLINTSDIEKMINAAIDIKVDALIPKALGFNQPLAAVYHKRCLPTIKDLLDNSERRMSSLLKNINTAYMTSFELGIPEQHFININTRDDFYNLQSKD